MKPGDPVTLRDRGVPDMARGAKSTFPRSPVPGEGEFVRRHRPLVRLLARRLARALAAASDADQLESDGMLGLLLAARTFDPRRGGPAAYAALKVRAAMLDGARHRRGTPLCRRPFGRVAVAGLDAPGGDALRGGLPSREPPPGRGLELADEAARLLRGLRPAERLVVERCVMAGDRQAVVAAALGVSEGRVPQLRTAALARLRARHNPDPAGDGRTP